MKNIVHPRSRRRLWSALAVATLLALGACSSDGTSDDATDAADATATEEPATSAATEDAATEAAATEDAATEAAATEDGATEAAAGDGEAVQIAYFAPQANTYAEATFRGIEDVANERGGEVTRVDSGFDATLQFNQIQDAVTQERYDAFIIIPLDYTLVLPAVEEAIAAGVAVVNTDLALGPDFTTSDPQVEGQAGTVVNPGSERALRMVDMIELACETLDECQIGYIAGLATLDFEMEVRAELESRVAEHDNWELVAYQDGHGYLAEPAIPIAQNILQANPELNVLATSSDQATAGAELAVDESGRAGEILIVSSGGSCPAVEAVEEGRWFGTVVDLPYDEGVAGAEIAFDWLEGNTEPVGRNVVAESEHEVLLTADTLEGFECQWEG